MKVILLGDTHACAKSGDLDFAEYFNKFFLDVLYPYMKDNGIRTVIQAGDYFDNQNSLGLIAWEKSKPIWVDEFRNNGFYMHVLVGNHDISYKNTLRVNSPELILSEYKDSFNIVTEPSTIQVDDGYSFDLVPWICKENYDEAMRFIKKQKSSVLIGHFAIEGFQMFKGGTVERHGLPQSLFEQYPFVFSGHFHTRSTSNNIEYLGIPYEMTWVDYNDPKGFTVFDTVTQRVDFVQNPYTMFEKVLYKEDLDTSKLNLEKKIVKVLVTDRGDLKKYQKFLDWVKEQPTKDLIIDESVNDASEVSNIDISEIDWISNTTDYIKTVVESTETDLDKEDVTEYLTKLHQRASLV